MIIFRKKVFVGALAAAAALIVLSPGIGAGRTAGAGQAGLFPAFTPMPGLIPRGVAVDKTGNVFVNAGEMRGGLEYMKIWKFTPDGVKSPDPYADMGEGTIGGLAVSANGELFVAMAKGAARGVWRVDREGQKELLPGSPKIFFANGLAFDDQGTLWIAESLSVAAPGPPPTFGPGGIWRIRRGGEAELCLRDVLLGASDLSPLPYPLPAPIGANGIAYYHSNLYVSNTAKGTVLRVPIGPDGDLGQIELWATLEEVPGSPLPPALPTIMGDGLALDVHGNIYVAVLTRSAIVRINLSDKSQEVVAAIPSTPFDFPASLVFGTGMGERTSLFVTNLGNGGWAGPSLMKIDAGVPGRPLH